MVCNVLQVRFFRATYTLRLIILKVKYQVSYMKKKTLSCSGSSTLQKSGAVGFTEGQIFAKDLWVFGEDVVQHVGETNVLDDLTDLLLVWRRCQAGLVDQIEPRVGNVALFHVRLLIAGKILVPGCHS